MITHNRENYHLDVLSVMFLGNLLTFLPYTHAHSRALSLTLCKYTHTLQIHAHVITFLAHVVIW